MSRMATLQCVGCSTVVVVKITSDLDGWKQVDLPGGKKILCPICAFNYGMKGSKRA